jgi:ABC-2 type transport system permease protein
VNIHAIRAIYRFEMARTRRTLMQSVISPVLSTSLYFVVFGSAIGSRMAEVDGISYGAFIVPGLIMLSLLTQSIANASFGIYFPKFTGTIYELLSAPISYHEIVISYVGAAATKSIILGLIILATAGLFVPLKIDHPVWMVVFLLLTAVTFSLVGFIIGIWADGFEKLQLVPLLIVTPLTFLVQPRGLSGQRVPLEFLRHCGCQRRRQPGHDRGVHGDVSGDRRLDLQDGVSAKDVGPNRPKQPYVLPSRGPRKYHRIKPSSGSSTTTRVQISFFSLEAEL